MKLFLSGLEISRRRNALGFTQVGLASATGVSLPTLQNIEAGRANPSISTLTKLAEILGLQLSLAPAPLNWQTLSDLGVPLMVDSHTAKKRFSAPAAQHSLRCAIADLVLHGEALTLRQRESLLGFLMALRDHYPSIFHRFAGSLVENFEPLFANADQGRLIRLRRTALGLIRPERFS